MLLLMLLMLLEVKVQRRMNVSTIQSKLGTWVKKAVRSAMGKFDGESGEFRHIDRL